MKKSKKKIETGMPRFDANALRTAAGDKAFARGEAYFSGCHVEILEIAPGCVRARVAGTEIYQTELRGSGRRFSGECSCPVFSDRGYFCKHLVAVALAANDRKPGAAAPNRFSRIREHLRMQNKDALVEKIITLAERDPALLDDLELAATINSNDDETVLSRFKLAIAAATRISGDIEYRQVRAWALKVDAVLKRVGDLIGGGKAALVLSLLEHFFARMELALPGIDDADGHGGWLLARASILHFKACSAAKLDPIALARELFRRETEWQWDCFHGASETYWKVLGESGRAEYRRLAEQAWAEIKPLRGSVRRIHDDQFAMRYRLQSILESFAERSGDVDGMIAIRAQDLSLAYNYLLIAKLCADHDRIADALKWAEEGLWQFEDEPDKRLIAFAADLRRRQPGADISTGRGRNPPGGARIKAATSPGVVPAGTKGRRKVQ